MLGGVARQYRCSLRRCESPGAHGILAGGGQLQHERAAAALAGAVVPASAACLTSTASNARVLLVQTCLRNGHQIQRATQTAAAAADNRLSVLLFRSLLCCSGASCVAGMAETLQVELDKASINWRACKKLKAAPASSNPAVVLGWQRSGNWLGQSRLASAANAAPGVRMEGLQVRVGVAGTPAACPSDGAPPPLPLALPQPALLSPPLPLCC